jgi:hypothetical protein
MNHTLLFCYQLSALEMTPALNPSDINIIAADGLLSEDALFSAGIPSTCTMILDVYHLLQQDWPNYFKTAIWLQVKNCLQNLSTLTQRKVTQLPKP